jgi:outer membrane protein insertion porin family
MLLAGLAALAVKAPASDAPKPTKAKVQVSGVGWWRDRELRQTLERLLGEERREIIQTNAIEDATVILLSTLNQDGYLKATVEVAVTTTDGERRIYHLNAAMDEPLPRNLQATRVEFQLHRGVRYYLKDVRIEGVTALAVKAAESFFRAENTFSLFGKPTAYAPTRLKRSAENLREELRRHGFAEADVRATADRVDDKTGGVEVRVVAVEHAKWEVSSLRYEISDQVAAPAGLPQGNGRLVWSRFWEQDTASAIRRMFYREGYPDVKVSLVATPAPEANGKRDVAVVAKVTPGTQVRVGAIKFEGNQRTRTSVLEKRVQVAPGDLLNPPLLERSRYRLTRLGVFKAVDLRYEPADGPKRDAVFVLKEGRRWESSLLFGYGSYEQLRAGVEWRQYNLFGRAHESRMTFVQSMKSTRGEYNYTVPELFGESIDGNARVFGLLRDERSFQRQEYGGSLTLKRALPWLGQGAEVTAGYTYQALRNKNNDLATSGVDNKQLISAGLELSLTQDRRDNPLRPRHGYRWFLRSESSSPSLGGEADYQQAEMGMSYHTGWGRGRWIHAGLTHGLVTTWGASDTLLPVNERFYPGGENSIRGYQSGEAAPRGPDGRFLGAKSYVLLNLEFEQALTSSWSLVLFGDALGTAAKLADYPFNEKLYSVGIGIRYQTLIGPARLEYGRNLNPRQGDPGGTLHLSLGFPF